MRITAFALVACLVCAVPAVADTMFSSTFDGTSPWNWDAAVGSCSGTDQLDVPVGPTAGASIVQEDLDTGTHAGDGTGTLIATFDVDLNNMAFDGYYSGPAIFEMGTVDGNKSAYDGTGCMVRVNVQNWKADPGVGGEFRFGISDFIRYWNPAQLGSTGVFSPTAGQDWTYQVEVTTVAEKAGTVWTVTSDLAVTGPSGGEIVTLTAQSYATRDDGSYDGLLDVNKYRLGVLGSDNTVDNTSMSFDNFNVVPEPATLALLGAGALAMIRRKR
jgi:PEP-CTERM motif